MAPWIPLSMVTLVFWALWAFLPKLAMQRVDYVTFMAFEILGSLTVGLIFFALNRFQIGFEPKGACIAFMTGAFAMAGGLTFFYALKNGPIGTISMVTALYPLPTLLLAYLVLGETLTLQQGLGAVLGVVSLALMVI